MELPSDEDGAKFMDQFKPFFIGASEVYYITAGQRSFVYLFVSDNLFTSARELMNLQQKRDFNLHVVNYLGSGMGVHLTSKVTSCSHPKLNS